VTTLDTAPTGPAAVDPISLEVLRSRLEAILAETAATLERTAISPVVTESKDYSCTLLDAEGRLIAGTGQVVYHFGAAAHAVRSTLARHGERIADGDVFIANDPHSGGGLHPQDVMVQRPVFVGPRLVAWAVMSAHMMDMGGSVPGSFAPVATECFQEALRVPPVRLFRAGEEQPDVWAIFRTNVRLPDLIEMDLRSLVAGCHVAAEKVAAVVGALGIDAFVASLGAIRDLTEAEWRRRIGLLEDGVYRAASATEWDDEFFTVPCALSVDGDRLVFDFEGASPQTNHFFNSKPYIVASEMVAQIAALLARDLPYNDGIFAPVELRCPEGTVVNSRPPAPIAAAHMDVALNAAEVGMQCIRLAIGASPDAPARRHHTGWGAGSALGLHTWSGPGIDGAPDAFIMLDGNWAGSAAGAERDGLPLAGSIVGNESSYSFTDIEILEAWYPILVTQKRARAGATGAGRHRSGGGNHMGFTPHGTPRLTGAMLGMRRWLPLEGAAGGFPGARTQFLVRRATGEVEEVATHASGIVLDEGDVFEFRCASGGGYGDPLDRPLDDVERDVARGRYTAEEARAVYGVVLDGDGRADTVASAAERAAHGRARLARAQPAPTPVPPSVAASPDAPVWPLAAGVVQRGTVAVAEASGAPLAVAPDHWTDGCPVLVERIATDGPEVHARAYLDPRTGRSLYVEAVPAGRPRSFEVSPRRWTDAR
jgi:N-methylhydantoinase B